MPAMISASLALAVGPAERVLTRDERKQVRGLARTMGVVLRWARPTVRRSRATLAHSSPLVLQAFADAAAWWLCHDAVMVWCELVVDETSRSGLPPGVLDLAAARARRASHRRPGG